MYDYEYSFNWARYWLLLFPSMALFSFLIEPSPDDTWILRAIVIVVTIATAAGFAYEKHVVPVTEEEMREDDDESPSEK